MTRFEKIVKQCGNVLIAVVGFAWCGVSISRYASGELPLPCTNQIWTATVLWLAMQFIIGVIGVVLFVRTWRNK